MEPSYHLSCSVTLIHVANSLRMPPLQLRALLRNHALACGPGGDRTLVADCQNILSQALEEAGNRGNLTREEFSWRSP
jgi:hypothetical protein